MSTYEVFKDFAGPVATIIASLTAASVASIFAIKQWQTSHIQAQIALDKLKLETFDSRMGVLSATRSLIRLVVNSKSGEWPKLEEMKVFRTIIDDGRFLFNKDIRSYLSTLVDACYETLDFDPHPTVGKLTQEERDAVAARNKAKMFVMNEMQRLPAMLESEIAPNFLRNNALLKGGLVWEFLGGGKLGALIRCVLAAILATLVFMLLTFAVISVRA